ncbi:uncharacterized protein LOC143292063 [Babylonia areolata]|uniref:uncharacterized protein LOC143292063 n=1 Tax=Babylonia areolata TaxID=304850 RepID=UPI003FD33E69
MDQGLPEKLKKMMTAMSESEDSPSLWGMGVVAITICVRLLHSLAQKELSLLVLEDLGDATSPAVLTLLLACLQVAAAVSVFRVSGLSLATSPTNREAAVLGLASYAGGAFLSNYLLWSDDSAAAACYAAMEPALCVLLLYLAARIPTESNKAGAVVGLCLGAALLSARFALLAPSVHALFRVLASVFLLVRNMVVKHLYDSAVSFHLRGQNTLLAVGAGGTVASVVLAVLVSGDLLLAALMLVVCGVLSVTLMQLLLTLLSLYDTLTVAVFLVWAQVLENVVIVGPAARPALLPVLLGAVLFAAGHYVYFREGLDAGTVHLNIKQVGVKDLFTRLQFILYTTVVLGLLAAILMPYLSDSDFLSNVGLDKFL